MHCILCTVLYALYSFKIILWIVLYTLILLILSMQLVLCIFFDAICYGPILSFTLIYANCSLHLSIGIFMYMFYSMHAITFISVNAVPCILFYVFSYVDLVLSIFTYAYCSQHLFCQSTLMYLAICIVL